MTNCPMKGNRISLHADTHQMSVFGLLHLVKVQIVTHCSSMRTSLCSSLSINSRGSDVKLSNTFTMAIHAKPNILSQVSTPLSTRALATWPVVDSKGWASRKVHYSTLNQPITINLGKWSGRLRWIFSTYHDGGVSIHIHGFPGSWLDTKTSESQKMGGLRRLGTEERQRQNLAFSL